MGKLWGNCRNMASGLCGFGPVHRAFIIAPTIGDMFVDIIDITNAINITTLINWLACCA